MRRGTGTGRGPGWRDHLGHCLLHLAWVFWSPLMSGLKRRRRKEETIFPQPGPWPAWEATASTESGSCFKQVIKALSSAGGRGAWGRLCRTMRVLERPCLALACRSFMACPSLAKPPLVPGSSSCSFIYSVVIDHGILNVAGSPSPVPALEL